MKIAIHERKGSFSDRWIQYCDEYNIDYKIVNCYDSDIIEQLRDCDGLMWHWSHMDYRDQNFARQLIFSIEKMGLKVFPNFSNCWHFDDKVGQKYLFESIKAPLVNSYVFYDKENALKWVAKTSFPKVFKLRGGAGSRNVILVKSKKHANKLIKKAFKNGFPLESRYSNLKDKIWQLKRDKNVSSIIKVIKGFGRIFFPRSNINLLSTQKGYIYFQDFIPNNKYDTRIVIVGNKAIGEKRFVRNNDFRASGSGEFCYDMIDLKFIEIAFKVSEKLNVQSIAFDFIYSNKKEPLIIEISYCFGTKGIVQSKGFWDKKLVWYNEPVNPQYFIIEDFINSLENK